MNYFEISSKRLNDWILESPHRISDFKILSNGRTLTEYVSVFAYVERIIPNVVEDLMKMEARRVIMNIEAHS